MTAPPDVPSAGDVVRWFGCWPSFHDAEIVSVHIVRSQVGQSELRVHAWLTGKGVDSDGHLERIKPGIVVFRFRTISFLRLEGEDADLQNVLQGIHIERQGDAYRIELSPCYGLYGELLVRELSIGVEAVPAK